MNCEHANPEFIATPESTHHGKYICPDCGRFIGWAPKPETVERQKTQRKLIAQLSEDSMPLSPWETVSLKPGKNRKLVLDWNLIVLHQRIPKRGYILIRMGFFLP